MPVIQHATPTLFSSGNVLISGFLRIVGDYFEAISFNVESDVDFADTRLVCTSNISVVGRRAKVFLRCIVEWAATNNQFKYIFINQPFWRFEDSVFLMPTSGGGSYSVFWPHANTGISVGDMVGCDFSGINAAYPLCSFQSSTYDANIYRFHRSKFNGGQVVVNAGRPLTSDDDLVEMFGCDFGAGYPETRRYTYRGNVLTDAVVVPDDDAVFTDINGAVLSQRLDASVNCSRVTPVDSIEMRVYVDVAGNKTITVDALESYTSALLDGEAWITVRFAETAGSVESGTSSGRVLVGGDPLSSSAIAWLAAPVGSRSVSLSLDVALDNPCMIVVIVNLGRYESGRSLWVNPSVRVAAI